MPEFNRRQLFKLRLGDLTREVGKAFAPGKPETQERPGHPRPPGALADASEFLNTCESCHACANACPYDAIEHYGPAFGILEGTPYIDPAKSPCHWCEDMPCIAACPSGALVREDDEPVAPIGKVSLDLNACLNTQGVLCDVCSYRCPTHVKAIRMVDRMPALETDRCTGCGMCVYHCEAEPSAFRIVPTDQPTTNTARST